MVTSAPCPAPTVDRHSDDVQLKTAKPANNVDFVTTKSQSTVVPAIVMTLEDAAAQRINPDYVTYGVSDDVSDDDTLS